MKLIFCPFFSQFFTLILSTSPRQRKFNKDIQAAKGKKIKIHDLRYSHASYLINKNTNIVLIAERLRHINRTETLNTYAHLFSSKQNELMNLLKTRIIKKMWSKCGHRNFGYKKNVDKSTFFDSFLHLAGVAGIEPTMMVLETIVIPFNYTPRFVTLPNIFYCTYYLLST